MLNQLMKKLYEHHSDAPALHRAIKTASVAQGILTLEVANQAVKERIDYNIGPLILTLAQEIDPNIRELRTAYATIW